MDERHTEENVPSSQPDCETPPPNVANTDDKGVEVDGTKAGATTPQSSAATTTDGLMIPRPKNSMSGALTRRTGGEQQQVTGFSPMARRVAVGAGKAGLSIANGILLSRNAILNPVVSAALVAYESFRAVRDYRTGAVNALGYQTSRADVALRIGKEVGMAAIGMGIGQAVGALVGLSAIPIAGQIVLTAVLSVGVGICVGTLLTRHIDRLFTKWQIRSQYGYPVDEQGARRRFEQLLEERHDLTTFESCKIVQHYADYRVASGWESSNDIDDYRATGDIRHMPVSFQHFAIVQLQRKWGFLNDHSACKKVFKVLILQHHPDRGGSTEMAALLNRDYEIYAFCQGWDEDCPNLLNSEVAAATGEAGRPPKRSVVVDFLRSLFRRVTTTDADASDLHQFGLLTLEAGTRSDLHRLDELEDLGDDDGSASFASPQSQRVESKGHGDVSSSSVSGTARQRSVARVLSVLQQTYQTTSEAITFGGLARASEDKERWTALREEVALFNRLQCFVHVEQECSLEPSPPSPASSAGTGASNEHICRGFHWDTVEGAVERREQARIAIIGAVFSKETSEQLDAALNLWRSAQSLAQSYFKQCAAERQQEAHQANIGEGDGTGQTLETLLIIQRKMQNLSKEVNDPWKSREGEWATKGIRGSSTLMEDMRTVGLTASYALAGEHAKTVVPSRIEECETYFEAWWRKRHTIETVLGELRDVTAAREAWRRKVAESVVTTDEAAPALEEIQQRTDNYTTQLVLLQQQQGEIDAKVAELVEVCTFHLPEAAPILSTLPSTCARVVDGANGGSKHPRHLSYERERTLMNYQRVEQEVANKMVQPRNPDDDYPADLLHPNLFKAMYTDTLTGTESFCWLKSYFFPVQQKRPVEEIDTEDDCDVTAASSDVDGKDVPDKAVRRRHAQQDEILQQVLATELTVSDGCHSRFVLSSTDVFCDPERRRIFFQLPRGATQKRFSSVYEVRQRIRPLGLRWLLDAMQCLIDLHSCQLGHGQVSLSSFTFDDFGNTMLGFFDSARRVDAARLPATRPKAMEMEKDVIDFGAMLLSEVLPYLFSGTGDAHVGALSATPPSLTPTAEQICPKDRHVAVLFREVGERLIGKEDPRWSLLQARTFVRRCLQFNFETDESTFLFTKEITFPAYWGPPRALLPQLVSRRLGVDFTCGEAAGAPTVFLNVNVPLWETYWTCRRTMCLEGRMGTYSSPLAFQAKVPLLVCSDDCEVNERFLWFPCDTEEGAWDLCQNGFPRIRRRAAPDGTDDVTTRYKDTARLHFEITAHGTNARSAAMKWGVVCRVAVGTVVSTSANPSFAAPRQSDAEGDEGSDPKLFASKIAFAAKRRCHLETAEGADCPALLVPCPWGRCYPEYVVCWRLV